MYSLIIVALVLFVITFIPFHFMLDGWLMFVNDAFKKLSEGKKKEDQIPEIKNDEDKNDTKHIPKP